MSKKEEERQPWPIPVALPVARPDACVGSASGQNRRTYAEWTAAAGLKGKAIGQLRATWKEQ